MKNKASKDLSAPVPVFDVEEFKRRLEEAHNPGENRSTEPEIKQVCKLVFMENGVPKECGGVVERATVAQPFTSHTRIGGPPEPPIFSYRRCGSCGVMYVR